MIRRFLICTAFIATVVATDAQELRTPQPSPTQTIKQNFGIGSVELSYSRPGMRGRKIFGDLVPFGNVWRTGANNATTLTFSDSVSVGGTKVAPGTYGLLSIPGRDQWTMILSKQVDVTSPAAYKQENDVARVTVKPLTLNQPVETFTMQFSNIKPASADLQLMWENTAVNLPIATDVEGRIMAQINNLMNGDNRPYFQSAMFYLENGKDLNQAITWFDKAIAQNPNAFWILHQKANALAKMGKKDEAKQTAMKSMELAKTQKNSDYVTLNEKLIATLK
jgi:hypothetical protein